MCETDRQETSNKPEKNCRKKNLLRADRLGIVRITWLKEPGSEVKTWQKLGLLALLVCAGFLGYRIWKQGEPRRGCIKTLEDLSAALNSGNSTLLLKKITLPLAIAQRKPAEQSEFLTKALRDEISPEGPAELRKHGKFGPLKEIVPIEGTNWAAQAHVEPNDCVVLSRLPASALPVACHNRVHEQIGLRPKHNPLPDGDPGSSARVSVPPGAITEPEVVRLLEEADERFLDQLAWEHENQKKRAARFYA